jgi:hypothetical protein
MISETEFELARTAGEHLDRVRSLLLSPTLSALEGVTSALEATPDSLARLECELRSGGEKELGAKQELRRELRLVKKSLIGVERLMASAAAFHAGWAGLIGVAVQTYSRTGQLQTPVEAGQVSFSG